MHEFSFRQLVSPCTPRSRLSHQMPLPPLVRKESLQTMMEGPNKDGMILARMRAPRLSCQQFEVMIKFMKAHPHFAAGRAGGSPGLTTREEHEMWWQQLTSELNATIGPSKSTHKWQKCWVDLKSNARGRVAKIRAAMSNPVLESCTPALTQWDHQVLSLMGPAFADILSLFKHRKDTSTNDSNENNSNSSFQDQEQGFQQYENSSQQSPFHHTENGHHTESSNAMANDLKQEADEDDQVELVFEEVECEVEDDGAVAEDLEPEQCNPFGSGVSPQFRQTLSPSVTVRPVTVPINRQTNMSLVSSSTTIPSRLPVFSDTHSARKRKLNNEPDEDEVLYEKVPRGTVSVLERLANAAEESNSIQRQMAAAMNRLSDSIAQILPLVQVLSSNASTSERKS